MSSSPCRQLRDWLDWVSDSSNNPWPDGSPDPSPVHPEAEPVDPTHAFNDVSDEWTDDDSSSEEDPDFVDFNYKGKKDSDGRFHIYGTLTFDNGDVVTSEFRHGVRHGDAVVISERLNISRLCGTYVNGKMQGKGTIVSSDTTVTECFFKDGVIHGPVRQIGMKKFREFRRQLLFIGKYRNGKPAGNCWEYREGGGFIYGEPDDSGKFTGDQIAFIYPDLETALVGRFVDGVMAGARETSIEKVNKDSDEIMRVKKFSAQPNAAAGVALKYSRSTKTSMGEDLTVVDPYERKTVVCRKSEDLLPGTIVAFYNGVRLPYVLGGPKEEWDTSGYKIYINADYKSGERMNIPEEYVSLDKYCATLGHKMNHSFRPNCIEWFFDHPRFGVIPCERTTEFVAAGEELFLDYEYDPYNCPAWFKEAIIQYKATLTPDEYEVLSERYKRFQPE